jgi:murein tripeptide amidase MpaA
VSYLNVTEVESAIAALATANPTLCERIALPNLTVEGRTCHLLRIGKLAANQCDAVYITAGIHAREWGSCEIAVSFASDLIDAYRNSTGVSFGGKSFTYDNVRSIMEGLNVIVFPCVNPDGRNYSQMSDANWRRNRNPAQSGGNPTCIGVDINRNFDFLWDFPNLFSPSAMVNTSTDPCSLSQNYRGPSVFSENETKNVQWVHDSFPRIRWFVDLHSSGEDILYSWGDDQNQTTDPSQNLTNAAFNSVRGVANDTAYKEYIPSADQTAVIAIANRMQAAIQAVRGKNYAVEQGFSFYPTSGASDDYSAARHVMDNTKTRVYAYTVEWGTSFQPVWSEMQLIIADIESGLFEFCLSAPCDGGTVEIDLDTPSLHFNDVVAGTTTSRAIVFSVRGCQATQLQIGPGPTLLSGTGTFGTMGGVASLTGGNDFEARLAYLWVTYTAVAAGDTATGTVHVTCPQTGDQWDIPITCNVIAAPTVVTVMVLDKSGSMDWDAGGGRTRIQVLHDSAPPFVDVCPEGDAIGIVSFDQAASTALAITTLGPVSNSDPARTAVKGAISAHVTNPNGSTSIGNGVDLAHAMLTGTSGFTVKATVVLTDGQENTAKFISQIMGEINEQVFAIGLGTVEEVNPVALTALTNATGGYLLMTGVLGNDDYFRLSKYYMQILAGVTNANVVRDPDGWLYPGDDVLIPFRLTEADYSVDVIALATAPRYIAFTVETPDGIEITPALAAATPGASFMVGTNVSYYRMTLPVPVTAQGARAGTWNARLRYLGRDDATTDTEFSRKGPPIRYSLNVHTLSNLRMEARLAQTSQVPGATITLRVLLTEYDLPLEGPAAVQADITYPDGSQTTVALQRTAPGIYTTSWVASLSGIYLVRVRASGKTSRGRDFTREQLLTGVAWKGGDAPLPKPDPGDQLCKLLECLLGHGVISHELEERLARAGLHLPALRKCIAGACADKKPPPR